MRVEMVRTDKGNEADVVVTMGNKVIYYKTIYYVDNENEYNLLKEMAEKNPKIKKAFEEGRVKWG